MFKKYYFKYNFQQNKNLKESFKKKYLQETNFKWN